MALTPSTMLALGTSAPDFSLPDTNGQVVSLRDFAEKQALLVMFICNHCPFVKHVAPELAKIGRDYTGESVGLIAISSNSVESHPDDGPDEMRAEAANRGYTFPYLYDETQSVAKAYSAACTPDFFLFDAQRQLAYRGQLDDSRPGNGKPLNGKNLRDAIDAVLANGEAPKEQRPSVGCNIKWKSGNEPAYAKTG